MSQPGNVKLHPELLGKHQAFVKQEIGSKESKPVFFVFHGGSGSTKQEYLDAISHGVVKVNVDVSLSTAAIGLFRFISRVSRRRLVDASWICSSWVSRGYLVGALASF